MKTIRFLFLAYRAYRVASATGGVSYVALSSNSVPTMAIFAGLDRQAWRISLRAMEDFTPFGGRPSTAAAVGSANAGAGGGGQ